MTLFKALGLKQFNFKYALIKRFSYLCLISAFFLGCASVPPPLEDYAIARSALEAARALEASRFTPATYQQAEVIYKKAQLLFEDHEFQKAQSEFIKARKLAEKAETQARIQKLLQGEVL